MHQNSSSIFQHIQDVCLHGSFINTLALVSSSLILSNLSVLLKRHLFNYLHVIRLFSNIQNRDCCVDLIECCFVITIQVFIIYVQLSFLTCHLAIDIQDYFNCNIVIVDKHIGFPSSICSLDIIIYSHRHIISSLRTKSCVASGIRLLKSQAIGLDLLILGLGSCDDY